jgi:hypothetical protein
MSKYVDDLLELYNEEDTEQPKSYVKSIEKLLKFYGVDTDLDIIDYINKIILNTIFLIKI